MVNPLIQSDDLQQCSKCGSLLKARPLAAQPTLLNSIFGISFLLFLLATHYRWINGKTLWFWSGAQVFLGIALMRARVRSKKIIFRCTRCKSNLRS